MRSRGFTLIELVITLAIIALLTTAAMPLAQLVAQREKEAELRAALRDIRTALDAYHDAALMGHIKLKLGDTGYPPDLKSLYAGVEDQESEKKVALYFLRRVPRDPFYTGDADTPPEDTWAMRAFGQPPAHPDGGGADGADSADAVDASARGAAGKDVFDVSSKSDRVGINGIPYRQW